MLSIPSGTQQEYVGLGKGQMQPLLLFKRKKDASKWDVVIKLALIIQDI